MPVSMTRKRNSLVLVYEGGIKDTEIIREAVRKKGSTVYDAGSGGTCKTDAAECERKNRQSKIERINIS